MDGVGGFMKLSARLQQIANQLPEGCRFADIGSDHALLPVAALRSGKASSVVAGEVNDGPLEAARRGVAEAGLQARISVRKGNGLEVITQGEVDVITIAGMGGALIVSILEEGSAKLTGIQRLILQPNVGEDMVRKWLFSNGWVLVDERIIEEDGKVYEILTADAHSDAQQLNEQLYRERKLPDCDVVLTEELLLLMGPHLTLQPVDVFFSKWESEISKLERIRQSLGQSTQEESLRKLEQLDQHISNLKEVLLCLQRDKQ